ncbi:MAG: phosphomannomutase/phosphoglucomutase [bacterium]
MQVNANIFREYDIRGIAGTKFSQQALQEYEKWYGKFPGITITLDVAEAIGKAYGTMIRQRGGKKVVVGHEIRPYGEEIKTAFIQGVLSTGCDVADAGVSLTPIIYFAIANHPFDGGVNVTGSHNVYFYNGFKTMAEQVYPIYGAGLQEMRRLIETEEFLVDQPGKVIPYDAWIHYKKYLLEHVKLAKKLKVVVDCGNGSAGVFIPQLLRELGCEVHELYTTPDATFPNHVPDPEDPFVMTDLSKKVVETHTDIGVGIDADGDRFGSVDEAGNFISADRVILLLAKDILTRHPGKQILYDVKCSRLLEDLIPTYGGKPLIHVTGHAPIKQSLRENPNIIFGGEVSGHLFFVENYYKIDDALFATAQVLQLVAKSKEPYSKLFSHIPSTVMTPELKLPCADTLKHQIVQDIAQSFSQDYKTITIDGVRVIFSPTSWGLVRASNTSPYLTIRVEADTEQEVINIKNILADQLEKYPEIKDKLNRESVTTHTGTLGWV